MALAIPGEWHCAMCNRGGWHTKEWCFRCGTSRAESEAILRGSAQGFQVSCDTQAQHDIAFQRVVDGSVISSAKNDGPGIEDLSDDGELSRAMSEDDPDLAPRGMVPD